MGMQFAVHVVDDDGDPVHGVEVTVHFTEDNIVDNFLKGYTTLDACTDEDGRAEFETAHDSHDYIEISCHGERFGPYDLEEGAEFTISI